MIDTPFAAALDQAAALRSGRITAEALLERQLARVDAVNGAINAIIWQDRDAALAEARRCDAEAARGAFRGPLHGVPVTVKESFDIAGAPSTWGDPAWRDNIAAEDADTVKRYRAAGAVVFGKTNVPLRLADWQTFNAVYGTTNNPWDQTRTPGGSSGGAAAALASGMTALEVGSDIGSSIRNPAHYCGVFGHKPSWGVVSEQGQKPRGWMNDVDITVSGPLARSAADLSLGFELLQGPDRFQRGAWASACPGDDRTKLSAFKVAVKFDDPQAPVDQAYIDALSRFTDQLAKAGASVTIAEPKIDTEAHYTLYLRLLGAALASEMSAEDVAELRAALAAFGDPRASRVLGPRLDGVEISHGDWLRAGNARRQARLVFDAFFEDYDVLICPVARTAAFPQMPEGKRFERMITVNGMQEPEFVQLFWAGYSGVVHLPSTVGPMDQIGGLPVGYQAIAGFGRDRTSLAFARAVEREIVGFVPPPDFA